MRRIAPRTNNSAAIATTASAAARRIRFLMGAFITPTRCNRRTASLRWTVFCSSPRAEFSTNRGHMTIVRSTHLPLILAAALAACGPRANDRADQEPGAQPASEEPSQDCSPLETRVANAPDQRPAFKGQTRACRASSSVAFNVTVVATGLVHPWSVEPLPGGDFLVTERPGRLRIVSANGTLGQPITGLPRVDARGQGGLLDVALSPSFANDRTIFWSYSEPREGGNGTAVARGALSADRRSVTNVRVIFRVLPTYAR